MRIGIEKGVPIPCIELEVDLLAARTCLSTGGADGRDRDEIVLNICSQVWGWTAAAWGTFAMPGIKPSVSPCNIDNLSDHYLLQHLALASSQFESGETHYQQLQSCVSLREAN
jgi:hypothetical protein